jgi:hypothetical protein
VTPSRPRPPDDQQEDPVSGFMAHLPSFHDSEHVLLRTAGSLYQGCLDRNTGTYARSPYAPDEVATEVDRFARFADDQYRDLVMLVAAVAIRLKETGERYVVADQAAEEALDRVLTRGVHVAPEDRK